MNWFAYEKLGKSGTVLIDTWWNVNSKCFASYSGGSGFNRYMVECEYARKWLLIDIIKGFNRYMVECESL